MAQPSDSLTAVARSMERHNVGAIVVVENGRPAGIVTDRDLALQVVARGVSPQKAVRDIMTAPVKTVEQSEGVFDTTRTMMDAKVRRLPVVGEDDRVVGIVTLDDLLGVLSQELSHLIAGIKPEMETK
ncbi:MAG TPA: CBS domain-containing protein [Gemmataceae bacterium]|nr:CBS domain-containing protein [Gemmataceae bacterium]